MLTVAGDHVPTMPFVEVFGSTGAGAPLQIGATGLNKGVVVGGLTVTVSVVDVAHCPTLGVKV